MTTKFKFTNKNITALPPHSKDSKSTEQEYSDTVVAGLKVLVGKSGNKKFLFRYTFRQRKCSTALGLFGVLTIEEARLMANRYKALIAEGRDPRQEKEEFKNRMTFADFVAEYYLPHARIHKRSVNADESKLKLYLLPKFGQLPLADITTQAIQCYHNHLRTTLSAATANRHLSLVSRIFSMSVQFGHCEKNPASGINKFQENNQHQRFLNNEEIRLLLMLPMWMTMSMRRPTSNCCC